MRKKSFCALGAVYGGDSPDYFELALLSVIKQTIRVPICLVVDGPIPSRLEEVLVKYVDQIDYLIRCPRNAGLGASLRHALEQLKTNFEYAIRFDSDDINFRNRFEVMINAIEAEGLDLVGSHIQECGGPKLDHVIGVRKVPIESGEIHSKMALRNPFNHPSVAFRIEAVLAVGNYEDVPFFEDWYLWAKMVASNLHVGNIDQPLVKFRYSADMLDRRRGFTYLSYEFSFFRKLWRLRSFGTISILPIMSLRLMTRLLPSILFKRIHSVARGAFNA